MSAHLFAQDIGGESAAGLADVVHDLAVEGGQLRLQLQRLVGAKRAALGLGPAHVLVCFLLWAGSLMHTANVLTPYLTRNAASLCYQDTNITSSQDAEL